MLHDAKEKVIRFGVSSPTLLGVTGNLKRCGHFQPPPIPDRVKQDINISGIKTRTGHVSAILKRD